MDEPVLINSSYRNLILFHISSPVKAGEKSGGQCIIEGESDRTSLVISGLFC
jgi:hypothetical protein